MDLSRVPVAAALGLFLAAPASAQVTLRDVIAEAMKKNPRLLAAGADFDAARGRALAAEGIDDFVLDARGSLRLDEATAVPGVPDQPTTVRSYGFDVGLTKPLPTGGALGLFLSNNYDRTSFVTLDETGGEVASSSSSSYSPAIELRLDHPILRGIGYDAARGVRRRSAVQRDAARLGRENAAATVLRDVATAYWELRFAAEVAEVRRQLARGAREQLEIVDANIRAGKMPPSARAEVLVAAGLRDEEVLFADRQVLERSLTLRQLAGMPITAEATTLAAGDALEVPADTEDLAAALAMAQQRNPALASALASGRAARVDVEVTENGLLPQLDLSVIAGTLGRDEDAAEAYEMLGKLDAYTVQAALTFRAPLGNREARGNALAARSAWRRATLDAEDIALQTAAAVVRTHALTAEARRRLDVIAPTSEAAALDLAAERARFEVGRATNFDVLRRQDELAQTQLRQARARADLLNARAALWAATGEIFERYGVTVR
jgi:outer membrane protein TolC